MNLGKRKPKTLYHGSPVEIKSSFVELKRHKRVSATPDRSIAMLHSVKNVSDMTRTQLMYKGLHGRKEHELRMSGEDIENLKKPGWIYVVDGTDFALPKDKNLSKIPENVDKIEWVSDKSVKILKRTQVRSLYAYMKKYPGRIRLLHKRGPLARWATMIPFGPFIATEMTLKDVDDYIQRRRR